MVVFLWKKCKRQKGKNLFKEKEIEEKIKRRITNNGFFYSVGSIKLTRISEEFEEKFTMGHISNFLKRISEDTNTNFPILPVIDKNSKALIGFYQRKLDILKYIEASKENLIKESVFLANNYLSDGEIIKIFGDHRTERILLFTNMGKTNLSKNFKEVDFYGVIYKSSFLKYLNTFYAPILEYNWRDTESGK